MQTQSSGPYCQTQFGALQIRQDVTRESDDRQAQNIRATFAALYEESPFSKAFLADDNMSRIFEKIRIIDTGDIDLPVEVVKFVVDWDDKRGYDNTAEMLKAARDAFMFNLNQQAENDAWDLRMRVVNQGLQSHCTERRRVRDSYVEPGDTTRQEGADRVRSNVSAALRCRVFGAPKAKTDGTVQLKAASRIRHLLGIEPDKIINTKKSWHELGRLKPPPVCEAGVIPQDVDGWAKEGDHHTPHGRLAGTPVLYHNMRDFHGDVVASQSK